MKTFFLCLFLIISSAAIACSGIQKSFCYVHAIRTNDHVISGVIISTSSLSVQMQVIDVFSGVETRSAITVWNGTDFNCTGNVSMKAHDLGKPGDTIIAILPMIGITHENTWDVTGDYRRPRTLHETACLGVNRDTIIGYVMRAVGPLEKYSYNDFKNYWQSHNNDCMTLSINQIATEQIQIICYDAILKVKSANDQILNVIVYSIDGKIQMNQFITKNQTLDCRHLPAGIYLVTVNLDGGGQITKRMVL